MPYDLILRNGRILDPSQDLDKTADIAFAGGRVAAISVPKPDAAPVTSAVLPFSLIIVSSTGF